ncbi:MAG: hypothetical protein M1479_00340 [Actinobacteria bacterium]|nr:hypothetical protein [Actinomycetota bacterium]
MKYFRIFIAILFFFISSAIPILYQVTLPQNMINLTSSFFFYFLLRYLPIILTTLSSIVFLVYLLKFSWNSNLYWSNFFLAFTINLSITLLIDIPIRITEHIKWINILDRDKGSDFFYEITAGRIFGWFFTFIAVVGFICLFLYFRNKYKSKNIAKKLA